MTGLLKFIKLVVDYIVKKTNEYISDMGCDLLSCLSIR